MSVKLSVKMPNDINNKFNNRCQSGTTPTISYPISVNLFQLEIISTSKPVMHAIRSLVGI